MNRVTLILLLTLGMAQGVRADSIDALLDGPRTKFFQVARDPAGRWTVGNGDSYYAHQVDETTPVFTTGNGSLEAVVGPNGGVRSLITFAASDEKVTEVQPGGWTKWPQSMSSPLDLRISIAGNVESPATTWPVQTSYLMNAFPVSVYQGSGIQLRVVLIAPVTSNGRRPRALVWGVSLENTSPNAIEGEVLVSGPKGFAIRDQNEQTIPGGKIAFTLQPAARKWVPLIVSPANEPAASALDTAGWIQSTVAYWQRVTGTFTMPNDAFTAELFTRKTIQSLQSAVFDAKGDVACVENGGFEWYGVDNFRDSYYAILPATLRDPDLIRVVIPWFARHAVRPVSRKYPGGVSHSLGITLGAATLCSAYYESTGDRSFFRDSPQLVSETTALLRQVLATRKSDGPWLFPSSYVSDGRSPGDYHTGSNVCAWRCFKGWAQILSEAVGDTATGLEFGKVADRMKADLDRLNIKDGPFGPQYVEGTDADGSVPVNIHDGEESDTTLMPFYGYASVHDPAYRNDMRYAISTYNLAFNAVTRGVMWEHYGAGAKIQPWGGLESGATFPSYVTGLAADAAAGSLRDPDGYLSEIRRLTDVEGSWWWWPYGNDLAHLKRGKDLKRKPFQSRWADGTFVIVFQTNLLGIRYDAGTREMKFDPTRGLGDFDWLDFPIGNDRFSIEFRSGNVSITNHSKEVIRFSAFSAPTGLIPPGKTVRFNPNGLAE